MDLIQASEAHRAELLAHCYRMVGSLHDAEDLVQDTMLRAWRFRDGYDERRALPADLAGPSGVTDVAKLRSHPEITWLEPFPGAWLPAGSTADPGTVIEGRASIRLAFIAALQHLPPRQRAVLILRDVLAMPAAEVAELLETSVVSVNSALLRARAQLAAVSPAADGTGLAEPSDATARDLLERYMAAFAALNVDALKRTLRDDALLQMPPFPAWFLGREAIGEFMASVFGLGGSFRSVATLANGQPAIGLYLRRAGRPGYEDAHRYLHLQVLTLDRGGITRVDGFHGGELHAKFGLPAVVPD